MSLDRMKDRLNAGMKIRQPVPRIAAGACSVPDGRVEGRYTGEIKQIMIESELIDRESA